MADPKETRAFLKVLGKHTAPPKYDTRGVHVLDTVKGREVPLATAHRAIAQLKRRAANDIRAHFTLPAGFVFTPELRIAHRSMVTKEVARANANVIKQQVADQRERLTDGEKQALLDQALAKREQKSDNKALARIHKLIKDTHVENVGRVGISYLHADLGQNFKPELAGKVIHNLLMKSEGALNKMKVKFIVKGQFSRTVDGHPEWDHKWLSLNNKDSELVLSPPYYEGAIQKQLEQLKPSYFQERMDSGEMAIQTTWHDIGLYVTYEPADEAGGANNGYQVMKVGRMKCKSYRSTNNNCLIACLLAATGKKVSRHDSIRKLLNIELGTSIPAVSEAMGHLAAWFEVDLTIINEKEEELIHYSEGDLEATVCLTVDDKGLGHYVLVEDKDHVKKRCPNCNSKVFDLDGHECNANNIAYYNDKVNKSDKKYYTTRGLIQNKRKPKQLTYAFFDFETFNEASKACKSVTYNAGLLIGDTYTSFWGKDSLKRFMDCITAHPTPLLLISYNGSGFDSFFIMNYINEHKIPLSKRAPIIANGRILTLELENGTKFFDLYNYTAPSSLETLYDDCFNIKEGGKSFFPHQFIKSWADIEYVGGPITEPSLYTDYMVTLLEKEKMGTLNKKEKEPQKLQRFQSFLSSLPSHYSLRKESDKYLKIDCEVLQKCFYKMEAQFAADFGINILESITLSSAGEKYFRSLIPKDKRVELGLSKELYGLYKRANYGGRVQPHRQQYKSKDFGKPFAEIEDYLVDVDAVSLYPSVMESNEYPVGDGRWLTAEQVQEAQAALDSGDLSSLKHGVYNVDVVPNTRLLVPAIPSKSDKGFTCWNLQPSKDQSYMLPDIVSGVKHGYKFTLLKSYVFDDSIKIFSKYINHVFKVKQEEDDFKAKGDTLYNPTRRMIAKLLMNCLYGKMSQKPIEDSSVTINNEADFRKFLREYQWRDIHEMGDNVVAVGKRKDFSVCVRKPMQLGSYILAYSRTLMTSFMDKIDPVRMNITDRASLEESWANTFYYGDTDSMFIHSSTLHRLKGVLYDPSVHKAKELGMLDDELEGGKIVELYAPAPKLYANKYVTPDEEMHEKIRGKGIVSFKLKYEDFPRLCAEEQVSKSFFMMQKYRFNIPQGLQDKGFTPFSIEGRNKTRTLGKTQWQGRLKLEAGLTVPHGFDLSLLKK